MRAALLVALCLSTCGLSARADEDDEEQAEESAPAPESAAVESDGIESSGAGASGGAGIGSGRAAASRPGASRGLSGGGGGGGAGGARPSGESAEEAVAAAVGAPIVTTMQAAKSEAMARRGFNHANPVFATGVVYAYAFATPPAQAARVPVGEFHWSPVPSRNVCEHLSASISSNPGDMKGTCRAPNMGVYGDLRWTYGGKGCSLAPGKTYYFNLKCDKCVEGTGEGYQNRRDAAGCENVSIDDLLNWIAKPK